MYVTFHFLKFYFAIFSSHQPLEFSDVVNFFPLLKSRPHYEQTFSLVICNILFLRMDNTSHRSLWNGKWVYAEVDILKVLESYGVEWTRHWRTNWGFCCFRHSLTMMTCDSFSLQAGSVLYWMFNGFQCFCKK